MQYSYDVSSALGQVRGWIGDAPLMEAVESLPNARTEWPCVLADEEITVLLGARSGDVLTTASDALLLMASVPALTAARIRVGEYDLDARTAAAEMRAQSAALLDRAEALPAETFVEPYATPFQTREHLLRDLLGSIPGWEGS